MASSRIPYTTELGISKRVSGNFFRGTGNLIEGAAKLAEPQNTGREPPMINVKQ
jgi:hypothetical protein